MQYEILTVNIIATAFYSLNIILLFKIIYNKSFTLKRIVFFLITFAVINGSISFFAKEMLKELSLINSLAMLFGSVLLAKYILNVDFKKSFIMIGIFYTMLAVSEAAVFLLLRILNRIELGNILSNFITSAKNVIIGNIMVYLVSLLMVLALKAMKEYIRLPKNDKTVVLTITLTFFILGSNMWFYFYNVRGESNIVVFILIAVLIILYCAYILYNINMNYKLERQSIELEQQKFYNAALDKTLDNLRRFKHGYNNNLNVLYSYAKLGEYDKLLNYFDEIMEMNKKLNDTTALNIRNAGLYGIISSKIQYSEEQGVKFKINTYGEIKDIKDIRISELCEIMGILLDNAIEAAAASEDKWVTLDIAEDEECITITVKNSCDNPPDLRKIYNKGYSTKGEGRGMGLWIVKEILKNNKNVLNNAYMENGAFHQELIIKKGF